MSVVSLPHGSFQFMRAWLRQGEDIAPLDSTKLDTRCHENDMSLEERIRALP
jgi:hypothetical protein